MRKRSNCVIESSISGELPMSSERNHNDDHTDEFNPFREVVVRSEPAEAEALPVQALLVESSPAEVPPSHHPLPNLGRLHPLSLAFEITSHVRSLIIPAVIAVLSAAQGSMGGLILAGIIFFPTLMVSIVRYFTLRYRIHDAELVVTEGLLFRRIRTVPIERIQNIDLLENVAHRLFGVAEVRIETASGSEPEATLRVLSRQDVERLRSGIFQSQRNGVQACQDSQQPDSPTTAAPEVLLTIAIGQLVKAGLASNKGTLLLGVLIGMYFQFGDQIDAIIDFEKIVKLFVARANTAGMLLGGAIAVLLVFLLFRLLGIAWFILRFFGYQLTRQDDDLRIQCGLLTKISATVPRQRIQFISIHRNLFLRWMKLAAIRIETAGGAGHAESAKTVSSRWFVPVLNESRVREIIEQLRPGMQWNEDLLDWKPISPLASRRLTRLAGLASIGIAGVGILATRPWGWLAGVVALPILIWLAVKKSRSRRYVRNEHGVIYQSGIFTRKTSLTFFEKIQTVRLDESPFDRRWQMATLCVDTAAAGPADHQIHIDFLAYDFARDEFDAIVAQASCEVPVYR